MSEFIHKSHNVSVLLYHIVCPTKYRRVVINNDVEKTIKETCEGIEDRYEIQFLEIGMEGDHVHFLIQSVPKYSPTKIVTTIKGNISKQVFEAHPEVKKQLWGGEFWSDGYFVSTVSKYGNEETITEYVKNQGTEKEYKQMMKKQLELF
ncbi:IS200/IS605 family transposase ISDha13 [Spirochaetia bacterium]|nr:IS200/IS605 family transposase ISDha13 [Spirochaetia bacterium]